MILLSYIDLLLSSLSNLDSNDILQTLQASLSTSSPLIHPRTIAEVDSEAVQGEEAGKVLGRLMDWVEARQVSRLLLKPCSVGK